MQPQLRVTDGGGVVLTFVTPFWWLVTGCCSLTVSAGDWGLAWPANIWSSWVRTGPSMGTSTGASLGSPTMMVGCSAGIGPMGRRGPRGTIGPAGITGLRGCPAGLAPGGGWTPEAPILASCAWTEKEIEKEIGHSAKHLDAAVCSACDLTCTYCKLLRTESTRGCHL